MSYIPSQQINTGSYVPTTNVWDVSRIYEVEITSPEFKELFVRLYQNINNISLALNTKDSGFYVQEEFVTGQVWFNPVSSDPNDSRSSFRKVINTGALNAGATNVNHGISITNTFKFTRISGAASDTGTLTYVPLPYVDAAGVANISVDVTAAQVQIQNNSGRTFTDSYIVLEYVKN
jgi:hypothetical protein